MCESAVDFSFSTHTPHRARLALQAPHPRALRVLHALRAWRAVLSTQLQNVKLSSGLPRALRVLHALRAWRTMLSTQRQNVKLLSLLWFDLFKMCNCRRF